MVLHRPFEPAGINGRRDDLACLSSFFIFVCCRPGSSAAPSPINRADRSDVFGSCPRIRACQPPTPCLSCNEKVDWNDGRVFIDVVLEDESNDRRFFIVDVAISRFVEEITELHRLIPIH